MKICQIMFIGIVTSVLGLSSSGQSTNSGIIVQVDRPVAEVQRTMWGVFFEDINLGADGGIYAELVKNRSFEFYKPMMGWKILGTPLTEGDFLVMNRQKADSVNPRFLCVTLHNNKMGSIGLNNEGFRGMGIKKDVGYDFSLNYRQTAPNVKMNIELINENGEKVGATTISTVNNGNEWKKIKTSFTASVTTPKASLNIWFEGNGTIDLDMVSLFPQDTWASCCLMPMVTQIRIFSL